jgi:hypothetical protein
MTSSLQQILYMWRFEFLDNIKSYLWKAFVDTDCLPWESLQNIRALLNPLWVVQPTINPATCTVSSLAFSYSWLLSTPHLAQLQNLVAFSFSLTLVYITYFFPFHPFSHLWKLLYNVVIACILAISVLILADRSITLKNSAYLSID